MKAQVSQTSTCRGSGFWGAGGRGDESSCGACGGARVGWSKPAAFPGTPQHRGRRVRGRPSSTTCSPAQISSTRVSPCLHDFKGVPQLAPLAGRLGHAIDQVGAVAVEGHLGASAQQSRAMWGKRTAKRGVLAGVSAHLLLKHAWKVHEPLMYHLDGRSRAREHLHACVLTGSSTRASPAQARKLAQAGRAARHRGSATCTPGLGARCVPPGVLCCACLAQVRRKVEIDEARQQAALAQLKGPAPQPVPHLWWKDKCRACRGQGMQGSSRKPPTRAAVPCSSSMHINSSCPLHLREQRHHTIHPPHPCTHHCQLQAEGEHKGGEQAAHSHIVPPRSLALGWAVHRHKPDDEEYAPHLRAGNGEGREGCSDAAQFTEKRSGAAALHGVLQLSQ